MARECLPGDGLSPMRRRGFVGALLVWALLVAHPALPGTAQVRLDLCSQLLLQADDWVGNDWRQLRRDRYDWYGGIAADGSLLQEQAYLQTAELDRRYMVTVAVAVFDHADQAERALAVDAIGGSVAFRRGKLQHSCPAESCWLGAVTPDDQYLMFRSENVCYSLSVDPLAAQQSPGPKKIRSLLLEVGRRLVARKNAVGIPAELASSKPRLHALAAPSGLAGLLLPEAEGTYHVSLAGEGYMSWQQGCVADGRDISDPAYVQRFVGTWEPLREVFLAYRVFSSPPEAVEGIRAIIAQENQALLFEEYANGSRLHRWFTERYNLGDAVQPLGEVCWAQVGNRYLRLVFCQDKVCFMVNNFYYVKDRKLGTFQTFTMARRLLERARDSSFLSSLAEAQRRIPVAEAPEEQTETPQTEDEQTPPIRYVVGGRISEPKLVQGSEATYPAAAERAGIEGTVILEVLITKQGTVKEAKVLRGLSHGLTDAAVAAVKQELYQPAELAGEPVDALYVRTVTFELPSVAGE